MLLETWKIFQVSVFHLVLILSALKMYMSLLCNNEPLGTSSVPAQCPSVPNALQENLSEVWISGIQAHPGFVFVMKIAMDAEAHCQISVL